MSQLKVALMTLEEIAYTGFSVGTNFTVRFTAASEVNELPMTLLPGTSTPFTEHIGGLEVDPALGPHTMSVAVNVSGMHAGAPVSGSAMVNFSILPSPPQQVFSMNVVVAPVIGPPATFIIKFRSDYREYPVCYDPEWLCRNRYNWSAFNRWLCLGSSQFVDFNTKPEVTYLHQTFLDYTPRLQRISNELSLGFAPAGSGFFDVQTFTFDVVMGAALSIQTLRWGRRFTIEDFTQRVEDGMEDYMIAVHPAIDFQVLDLCRRWRELLDCFCNFCMLRPTLPTAATGYFDTNIAPHIDNLYLQVKPVAQSEGMPASLAPLFPSVTCDKLRYIVSFWAWYCRRCPLFLPAWSTPMEPTYTTLYNERALLNDILEANSLTLCNPPERNFCNRWLDIVNCLKKLCTRVAELPQSVRDDMETTFGAAVRGLATFLKLPGAAGLLGPGMNNTCALLDKIKLYFDKLCPQNIVPGGHIRRTQLDNILVSIETSMNGFKTRNSNLCANTVPMTDCEDWMPILDCLRNLCEKKQLFTADLENEILDDFTEVIDDLLAITHPTPPSLPEAGPITVFCAKLNYVWSFFDGYCPSGQIDPILKLRLQAHLAALEAAHAALLSDFPDICSETITPDSPWCDSWKDIFDCLERVCGKSETLNPGILDEVVDTFGSVLDYLKWLTGGGEGTYDPEILTFEEVCRARDVLKNYFNEICSEGGLDPVLKLLLDEQLDLLETAYNGFLTDYPGICAMPDKFCEEWVEVLDCMVRLCESYKDDPSNQRTLNTLTLAVERMGGVMSVTYNSVFGTSSGSFPTTRDKFCFEANKLMTWFIEHCACCGGTASQTVRNQLIELQVMIVNEYRHLVSCEPSCTTSQLSLATGTAPWMVTRMDNVLLTEPMPANIVTGTAGLASPISGSDWISPHETGRDSVEGYTTFERCFCVCTPGTVRVQVTYWADDTANIYLDYTTVDFASSQNMPSPESADVTLTVTAGRHCIRAEVLNDPTVNMAFCMIGTITAVTATLLDDDCCGEYGETLAPCADIAVPCDRIMALPRMHQFLCCPARSVGDPFYSQQAYQDILTALTCFEGELGLLLLAMGRLPDEFPLEGSGFCARMRRAVRVLMAAYRSFRDLPAITRRKVDCFYDLLRRKVSDLAATEIDKPLPCTPACEVCTKWLDLLECICRMCSLRPRIAASHPSLATLIDNLLCYEPHGMGHAAPKLLGGYNPCCEDLVYSYGNLLDACLCCTEAAEELEYYEEAYEWLYDTYETLAAAFATAGISPCETPCTQWLPKLECLAKLCLRRNELSSSLRTTFDSLFSTRVGLIYTDVFGTTPPTSPFTSTVFGTLCWRLQLLLRGFRRFCSPLYAWDQNVVNALAARYTDFANTYNSFMSQVNTAGYGYLCSQAADSCERLRKLPEQFRTVCVGTLQTSSAPVIAIEALLTQVRNDIPNIQKQLGLPMFSYPLGGTFCERLDFAVGIMAVAQARYDELAGTYRAVVDLFYSIYTEQVTAYAALVVNELPRLSTPMTEYRDQWTELLNCVCRACNFVAGLTEAERTTYAEIVDFFDGGNTALSNAIDDLYARVLVLAPVLNIPVVLDPCGPTMCERVQWLISFFTLYCLRCDSPGSNVVSQLETALDPLRIATVALRGAMQRAGRVVCTDENMETAILQSQALYLQAAGSDGSDGSSTGVHLRWALLNELGDHLPKGSLAGPGTSYYGTNPFNRKDDFVRVLRAPYGPNKRFAAVIDLATRVPDEISGSNGDGIVWTFRNVSYDANFSDAVTTIQISFEPGQYPWTPALNIGHVTTVRQNYAGVYRVEAIPKLLFAVEVDVDGASGSPSVKFEAISRNDDPNVEDPNFVSARLTVPGAGNPHRLESESMEYALFKCISCKAVVIRVESFDDFYAGSRRHYRWKKFGQYGLSLDDTEVYKRLEDSAKYLVDGKWPKYATGVPVSPGLMRVRVENYKDRWIPRQGTPNPAAGIYNRPVEQSLRAAVVKYLDVSKEWTNVEAWTIEKSIMAGDTTEMKLSLLELLNLGAQDYHIARMLGLGAIDWQVTGTDRYIYMAEYEAPEPLEAQRPQSPQAPTVHRYLSLPTGQGDARLPVLPTLQSLQYGLEAPYTNTQGYTRFGTHRYVRLYRNDLKFDLPVGTFFSPADEFSRGQNSRPILFGVKYASMANQNDSPTWAVPDPSNDATETAGPDYHPYVDNTLTTPEVLPFPDLRSSDGGPVPPLFTHRIKRDDGSLSWHKYALYSINWFSRVSPTVALSQTFQNVFPVINSLQPPLNLKVQYLQYEDVPLLNAPSENVPAFFGKTRVMFDWNHVHDLAYQFADSVDFYVRTAEPRRLRGKVLTAELVNADATSKYAWITTESYQEIGNQQTLLVEPALAVADVPLYLGSMLVTPSNRFEIVEVVRDTSNNNYAKLRVKVINTAGADGKMESGYPVLPLVGEVFLVVENINTIAEPAPGLPSWRRLDNHRIKLVKFTPHDEDIITEGRTEVVKIGGLVKNTATVVRRTDPGLAGMYDITMTGVSLGSYNSYVSNPNSLDVSFYKGTLRVVDPLDPTKKRSLEVMKIIATSPVTLLVFDPEDRLLSNGATSPMWVNFHPSYRLYVEWQAKESINPATTFEPVRPATSRNTYMAAKAVDPAFTESGQPYRSSATPPAIHLARLVQPLLPPEEPEGPDYASRPDFYGKSSYTFDTAIDPGHIPYGMGFYRADEMAILGALYRMDTIRDLVENHLKEHRSEDTGIARWLELINVEVESGQFKLHDGWRFPKPDKALEPGYAGPYADVFNNTFNPGDIIDEIREAIRDAFLPLVESYVVFDQVDESATLQTSSKKPTIRSADGRLLNPGDTLFDPYPMIRRTMPGDPNPRVRFTDYTLDGASRNLYFYFTREVSSGLAAGEASGVKGPVRMVNTFPPVAPQLISVRATPENAVLETKPEVVFQFNPPPEGEQIREIWIYRAEEEFASRNLRMMKQIQWVEYDENLPTNAPFVLRDTFSDLEENESIPYGKPLYYRVVMARQIRNENGMAELVPSVPSEPILVSIMDTVNPKAPEITVLKDTVMAPAPDDDKVLKFTNVRLKWANNTYNATYRLYKMSPQGQWTLIKTFSPPLSAEIEYNWSADPDRTPELMKLVDGSVIYHRFKVVVTNSSGLVSLVDVVKTI